MDLDSLRVARKQANDLVSEVDEAAEKVIIETLLKLPTPRGVRWPKSRANPR